MIGSAASFSVASLVAEPIQFSEPVSRAVAPGGDFSAAYPLLEAFGDYRSGSVGVESNAQQPSGGNGQPWMFFQTGLQGNEAGVTIDLGQAFDPAQGDSIRVSLSLGAKAGQEYVAPVVVALTDRSNGRPLLRGSYAPNYIDGQDALSIVFKKGLHATHGALGVTVTFKQDTKGFIQGLLRDIKVEQGNGLTGDVYGESFYASLGAFDYDGTIIGKEVLTPKPGAEPKLTGASVFGVRPGKPIRTCVTAAGERPMTFAATGLPQGVSINPQTGWITGRAPEQAGDVIVTVTASNAKGSASRELTLRVGDTICLTPPMGWNSWYVHSEGVNEKAIRDMATSMREKGLQAAGWTYVNIDDCWMGERDPETKRIQANAKFNDMKAMVDYVNSQGLKVGIYSTAWMSTFAGYVGGTAPNEAGDYSAYYIAEDKRDNPYQVFGRFPSGIEKRICEVGPVWFVDRDAAQFADWGIDYVKYDWLEWDLLTDKEIASGVKSVRFTREKRAEHGITQRFYNDFRSLDRDIVISLSPEHKPTEDAFVQSHSNLWRLTADIHANWHRLIAPFDDALTARLANTRPGAYGDLDMLQIGPMGRPNRAEKVFHPSRLKPAEQYFQLTLWSLFTQPLLLSCNVPTMDAFDLNLVTNTEVLAVNQDALSKQGYRIKNDKGNFEIWAKDLADGSKAVGLFNLADDVQVIGFTAEDLGMTGTIRDLWRQQDIGELTDDFSAAVSAHGVVFLRVY